MAQVLFNPVPYDGRDVSMDESKRDDPGFATMVPSFLQTISNTSHRLSRLALQASTDTNARIFLIDVFRKCHIKIVPYVLTEILANKLPLPRFGWPRVIATLDLNTFREEVWERILGLSIQFSSEKGGQNKHFNQVSFKDFAASQIVFVQFFNQGDLQGIYTTHPFVNIVQPWLPSISVVVAPQSLPSASPVENMTAHPPTSAGPIENNTPRPPTSSGPVENVISHPSTPDLSMDDDVTPCASVREQPGVNYPSLLLEARRKLERVRGERNSYMEDFHREQSRNKNWAYKYNLKDEDHAEDIKSLKTQISELQSRQPTPVNSVQQHDESVFELRRLRQEVESLKSDLTSANSRKNTLDERVLHYRALILRGRECQSHFECGYCRFGDNCRMVHTEYQRDNPSDVSRDVRGYRPPQLKTRTVGRVLPPPSQQQSASRLHGSTSTRSDTTVTSVVVLQSNSRSQTTSHNSPHSFSPQSRGGGYTPPPLPDSLQLSE